MPSHSRSKAERSYVSLMLGVLSAVENDAQLTQRSLSSDLGIALGLANAVLKRCMRKGLIKIANAPLNRYAYYLTPSGLREKGRLTVEYLRLSLNLFREARQQYTELFGGVRKGSRIALFGVSELAEAALLSARETGVEVICVVDPNSAQDQFIGVPITKEIADDMTFDAFVVCDLAAPDKVYARALKLAGEKAGAPCVLAPKLLLLSRQRKKANGERS